MIMTKDKKPYLIRVAEIIYLKISGIKKSNPHISNINAIEMFIGSKSYENISSGNFHNSWLKELSKNNFIDEETKEKIPEETIKLIKLQRDMTIKQLVKFPDLYYAKSHYPLEISQRSFDYLWRMCESYELWCKETAQPQILSLEITN